MQKPSWLKVSIPQGDAVNHVRSTLKAHKLHTVCEEARCPNRGECWAQGTATFIIMGATCTRNCRFCAVATGKTGDILDPLEGKNIALAVQDLKLDFAVLTSVDRDDLEDFGASHFALCVNEIKAFNPNTGVELLIPDYTEKELKILLDCKIDVIAHNIETVKRLQNVRDARASYEKSMNTLKTASAIGNNKWLVKSSIMLGIGETFEEVYEAMKDLYAIGVRSLVLGQYLRPTSQQIEVVSYITPEEFDVLKDKALEIGFTHIVSKPFARTSYHAKEGAVKTVNGVTIKREAHTCR